MVPSRAGVIKGEQSGSYLRAPSGLGRLSMVTSPAELDKKKVFSQDC
jgi:hypothetical protein